MHHSTNKSQKTPDDFSEAAKAFRSAVNNLQTRHEYMLFNILHMA